MMQHSDREYTMPRNEKKTRAKGWILKNTWIGPVLDIKVCRFEDRYSIEVLVDRTASEVRIVSGIDKYVTESMQTKEEECRASWRRVAKARPRHDQVCYQVSKAMIRFPRHDRTAPRKMDGASLFDDILEECRKKIEGASQWSLNDWISILAKGGTQKRFQYGFNIQTLPGTCCTSQNSRTFRRKCCGSWVARQCTITRRVYWAHLECKWNEFHKKKWCDSWRTKSQKRKTICVLHDNKPDGRW